MQEDEELEPVKEVTQKVESLAGNAPLLSSVPLQRPFERKFFSCTLQSAFEKFLDDQTHTGGTTSCQLCSLG